MASQTKLNIANGWVSIYRSLASSPLWLTETFTRGQAWVDMLLLTNHTDGYLRIRGNRVDINRGQLGWSKTELARRWNWSPGKVRRFFNELEKDKQIVQQKNHLTSIITVVNYSLYQNMKQQTNDKRLSNEQQTSPNNKKNKENKVNNENREFTPPSFATIISFFLENESSQREAEKYMNYYTANGWKIGKNNIQDWKAAAKNWILKASSFNLNINQKHYENEPNKYRGQKCDFSNQKNELTRTEQAKRSLLASVAAIDSKSY